MRVRNLAGERISAGNKTLTPKQRDPRAIASWVDGLEDLQRRRYIKDCGYKGEIFEVTPAGYKAADELPDA